MITKYYTVLATFIAKVGKEAELKDALTTLIAPTRAEAGCIHYDLHQNHEDSRRFMFYENWQNKAVHAEHMQTPHISRWLSQHEDLLEEPVAVSFWEMTE